VNGKLQEWPLKKGKVDFNFWNSAQLAYEAEHVRTCLEQGLKVKR